VLRHRAPRPVEVRRRDPRNGAKLVVAEPENAPGRRRDRGSVVNSRPAGAKTMPALRRHVTGCTTPRSSHRAQVVGGGQQDDARRLERRPRDVAPCSRHNRASRVADGAPMRPVWWHRAQMLGQCITRRVDASRHAATDDRRQSSPEAGRRPSSTLTRRGRRRRRGALQRMHAGALQEFLPVERLGRLVASCNAEIRGERTG